MRAIRLLVAAAAVLTGFAIADARAAELKVLSAGAMRGPLQELAPVFEKESGHQLRIEYATAGGVEQKVAADDEIDVAILTQPRLNKLVNSAKIVSGTVKPLAKAEIGLAVKKGAPKPDISSVDAVKKALLSAKSIAYIDPATGATTGTFLAQQFEKLGIAAELKPKTKLVSGQGQASARAGEAIVRGEAEIAMQPISELMEVPGIEVVGPLPAELQTPDTAYAGGALFASEQPIAAKALIDFLAGAKAKEVYKAKGLQPG